MQSIEISGIYTYIDNIKKLKIGDNIILRKNPNNYMTKEAIAAYFNDLKIGYIPFNDKMINIKNKYTIEKININQRNPLVTIQCKYNPSNFIELFPINNNNIIIKNTKYNEILIQFAKFLKAKGNNITDIGITYYDDNFIDLLIKSDNNTSIFHTVTRKYYEINIFKYDEFYKYKLIPKCIFEPFLIHRLETYIYKKYRSLEQLLNKKFLKYNYMIKENIIEKDDLYFEEIKIENNIDDNIFLNLKNMFVNINKGSLCYNHDYKSYCNIDYYDEDNIVILNNNTNNIINPEIYIKLLIIIIISSKINIYFYNNLYSNKILKICFSVKFNNYDKINTYIKNILSV